MLYVVVESVAVMGFTCNTVMVFARNTVMVFTCITVMVFARNTVMVFTCITVMDSHIRGFCGDNRSTLDRIKGSHKYQ